MSDYSRIEKAMTYMSEHASRQPSLEEIAVQVHLSPFHFQRLFCRWAGTTPKRFLQALTLERGKRMLEEAYSLSAVSHNLGLSGSSRLYDHFVTLEAATPGDYKNQGRDLVIEYGSHFTPLGEVFVAVTQRGICRMEFLDYRSIDQALASVRKDWPKGSLVRSDKATHAVIDALFSEQLDWQRGPFSLHVVGTNFQVAVWRALLRIPPAKLASYSQIASALGYPKASRAVGSAIGANPIALLVPCHRVIQKSGALGGYRWGQAKKQMLQTWEHLRHEPEEPGQSANTQTR